MRAARGCMFTLIGPGRILTQRSSKSFKKKKKRSSTRQNMGAHIQGTRWKQYLNSRLPWPQSTKTNVCSEVRARARVHICCWNGCAAKIQNRPREPAGGGAVGGTDIVYILFLFFLKLDTGLLNVMYVTPTVFLLGHVLWKVSISKILLTSYYAL